MGTGSAKGIVAVRSARPLLYDDDVSFGDVQHLRISIQIFTTFTYIFPTFTYIYSEAYAEAYAQLPPKDVHG